MILASVIIPVFNNEKIVEQCLQYLNQQSIDKKFFEIIIVDDGSTDKTKEVILSYIKDNLQNAKLVEGEHKGVSAARNKGLSLAKGKYVFYLDSDDYFSQNTISDVLTFFENNQDNIDLIALEVIFIDNNGNKTPHNRNKLLTETGIYNIDKTNHFTLSIPAICIKKDVNVKWDENLFFHEDEKYIVEVISKKAKFGYLKECKYNYLQHQNQATKTKSNPYFIFDNTINLYFYLIKKYNSINSNIYVQNLIINDFAWKLKSNTLWPLHLSGKEYKKSCKKILRILNFISCEIILTHPNINLFHKYYFLFLKLNKEISFIDQGKGIFIKDKQTNFTHQVTGNEIFIYSIKNTENDSIINIEGLFKSPIAAFKPVELFFSSNILDNNFSKKRINLIDSVQSYFLCRTRTNKFYKFKLKITNFSYKNFNVKFYMKISDFFYQINNIYIYKQSDLYVTKWFKNDYPLHNSSVRISKKEIIFNYNKNHLNKLNTVLFFKSFYHNKINFFLSFFAKKQKIWLYIDKKGIIDNAYYLFWEHCKIKDGIQRFYICDKKDVNKINNENNIVIFGSFYHKLLYIRASKVFTSFVDYNFFSPFSEKVFDTYFYRYNKPEIIYVTHGVMHTKGLHYHKEFLKIDKILSSTTFESDFLKKSGFNNQDIINAILPRLKSNIYIKSVSNSSIKKIIFIPSWRSYLVGKFDKTQSNFSKININASEPYIIGLFNILYDNRISNLLKKYNTQLEVKLHPIMTNKICIDKKSIHNNIKIIENIDNIDNYNICITDYSSFLYDFAFFNKLIMIYMPDEAKFKSCNFYHEFLVDLRHDFFSYDNKFDSFLSNLEKALILTSHNSYTGIKYSFFHKLSLLPSEIVYNNVIND